jgi:hypothetical protein
MKDFFLTIHSDQKHFKGIKNKTSCFNVHLGHEMLLKGDWTVGLAEIFYPMTMRFFTYDEQLIVATDLTNPDFVSSDIVSSSDEMSADDANVLNIPLAEEKEAEVSAPKISKPAEAAPAPTKKTNEDTAVKKKKTIVPAEKVIGLVNNDDGINHCDEGYFFTLLHHALKGVNIGSRLNKEHVWLQPEKKYKLILSDKMSSVLGFMRTEIIIEQNLMAPRSISMSRAIEPQLYVSTNLIHPQMVGGKYDTVLRCLHVDTSNYRYGCMGHEKYDVIYYYPVSQEKIDDVTVYIKNRLGECISFEDGPLTVVLHFKKVSDD